ncbi:MAG: glutathione S-transferase [Pseudomonadota bacterium]
MITIHHLNNSRSQRIVWLLEEIGDPYEIVHHTRDEATNLAPPLLTALHPLGKSPMIVDNDVSDGRLITESGAIVEYLARKFAPQLVPAADSDAHITHLELMHFAEGSAMLPVLLRLYTSRLGDAAAPLAPRIDEQLAAHFDHMERMLRPSGHYVLDDLSAADIMLSFPAEIARAQGFTADRPKLADFVDMVHARPAWQRAIDKTAPYNFA